MQIFFSLFVFFYFHFLVRWNGKIHSITSSFLLVNKYYVWYIFFFFFFFFFLVLTVSRSSRLAKIKWSVWISKSQLVHLILQEEFWVMHIPFVRMVKFKLLAQFPVDHLPRSVVSRLIPFCANLLFTLWQFFSSAFADGLSLEFEWQQVSSSLQGRSQ